MKTAVALRHIVFEDLDLFEDMLAERGFEVRYLDPRRDDLTPFLEADLAIILGGPMGVYEADQHPWLTPEIAAAGARLAAEKPLLGICLGSQIMAAALGAKVYRGASGREIGWSPLTTASGVLAPLAGQTVLHWHGDTFDLPQGATRLASSALYENQAFSVGDHGLALQFHLEVTAEGLERWFADHPGQEPGVDVPVIRADAARHGPPLGPLGTSVVGAWLDRLGL